MLEIKLNVPLCTNAQLAKSYERIRDRMPPRSSLAPTGGAWKIARSVRNSNTSIADFFHRHGSLRELKERGIGPQAKNILASVLEKGEEATLQNIMRVRRIISAERIENAMRVEINLHNDGKEGRDRKRNPSHK
jgi:hypothetical protein